MTLGTELVTTVSWNADKRKVNAAKACQERDADALIGLLHAYIRAEGKRGQRTSPATLTTYETGVLRWIDFCWPNAELPPQVGLLRATRDDVQEFVAFILDEGRREATAQAYLAAVKAFYRALVWTEAVATNPTDRVRAPADPRPPSERRDPVPFEHYKVLLEQARATKNPTSVRNLGMLRLFGDCGLRVAEATALELKDLDFERRLLTVEKGKGSKRRQIPIPAPAVPDLETWIRRRRPFAAAGERHVLINVGKHVRADAYGRAMKPDTVRSILERLYPAAGVPPHISGPHSLRHTAGSQLYALTGDLNKVARFLGHSNINTSAIYAQMDIENLRKSLDRMYQEP